MSIADVEKEAHAELKEVMKIPPGYLAQVREEIRSEIRDEVVPLEALDIITAEDVQKYPNLQKYVESIIFELENEQKRLRHQLEDAQNENEKKSYLIAFLEKHLFTSNKDDYY